MSEATIPFDDPEEIRTLLGARDEHLRRVRESVGVDVVFRDDTLKLQGDTESVNQGVAVIGRLREMIDEAGELRTDDVLNVLAQDIAARESTAVAGVELEVPQHVQPRGERPGLRRRRLRPAGYSSPV